MVFGLLVVGDHHLFGRGFFPKKAGSFQYASLP